MMLAYFEKLLQTIEYSLKSMDYHAFEDLVDLCVMILKNGNKVIASGLGKNVPICEKFVGTMLSFGLDAAFLHTNTAVHGDLGTVREGDLMIILSKSGETAESVFLAEHLKSKHVNLWLLTFTENSTLQTMADHTLILNLDHEGDMWDIVPNNSTTLNLITLQALAICTAERMGVTLETFKENHPGGHIGETLKGSV